MTPKHERLIERLTDCFWSAENGQKTLTDPGRMVPVVNYICNLLHSKAQSEEDHKALQKAADFLQAQLEKDNELNP
jgi:hypothetical protein